MMAWKFSTKSFVFTAEKTSTKLNSAFKDAIGFNDKSLIKLISGKMVKIRELLMLVLLDIPAINEKKSNISFVIECGFYCEFYRLW